MNLGFGPVTKAFGIELLTSIYFVSLSVLEKVVTIQGILYPQQVWTSRKETSSNLTKIVKKVNKVYCYCPRKSWSDPASLACLKALQDSAHGFVFSR